MDCSRRHRSGLFFPILLLGLALIYGFRRTIKIENSWGKRCLKTNNLVLRAGKASKSDKDGAPKAPKRPSLTRKRSPKSTISEGEEITSSPAPLTPAPPAKKTAKASKKKPSLEQSFAADAFGGVDLELDGLDAILPGLEEDLASLEADFGDGDFQLDFDPDDSDLSVAVAAAESSSNNSNMISKLGRSRGKGSGRSGVLGDEDELEAALRSIEAGKFDLDTFLLPGDGDEQEGDEDVDAAALLAGLALDDFKDADLSDLDLDEDDEDALVFGRARGPGADLAAAGDSDDLTVDLVPNGAVSSGGKSSGQRGRGSGGGAKSDPIMDAIPDSLGEEDEDGLLIAGLELDGDAGKDFDLALEAPPLEEFKRLMDSLGPDSMFDEEGMFDGIGEEEVEEEDEDEPEDRVFTPEERVWFPSIYEGGPEVAEQSAEKYASWVARADEEDAVWRVQIIAVVTNSSRNSTALEMVDRVFAHIRAGTADDARVSYQTFCYRHEDGAPLEELDDMVQMWLEGYNTYHLVDGKAMKEAWGAIMPHIMLSQKNLDAILEQVRWALHEDELDGALLTPRLRRIRFRGGAQEMTTGYNAEQLDSEFSVVSVR